MLHTSALLCSIFQDPELVLQSSLYGFPRETDDRKFMTSLHPTIHIRKIIPQKKSFRECIQLLPIQRL